MGAGFDDVRTRLAEAVPEVPLAELLAMGERGESWSEVEERTARWAPHGFLVFWQTPVDVVMRLAGDGGRSAAYLVGNHVVAERMYRHDPLVMLHAPLRFLLHQAEGAPGASLSLEPPSSALSGFGPEVDAVAVELDASVAALLRHLGADPPW